LSDRALEKRALMARAKMDYDKQVVGESGVAPVGIEAAGPPTWSRAAWDAFKAQYGFYPYGMQQGTMVRPPSMEGAPDWVYALMGMRRPPVDVNPGAPMLQDGVTDDLSLWKVR